MAISVAPAASKLDSISRLPLRLSELTGQPALAPRKVYELVLRGVIPATFVRGRWYFHEEDLPAIARALNLPAPSPATDLNAAA